MTEFLSNSESNCFCRSVKLESTVLALVVDSAFASLAKLAIASHVPSHCGFLTTSVVGTLFFAVVAAVSRRPNLVAISATFADNWGSIFEL